MKPGVRDCGKFSPAKDLPEVKLEKYGAAFCVRESAVADVLFRAFCFGRMAKTALVLSPYEVFFINWVEPRDGVDLGSLWVECSRLCAPGVFATRYAVYHFYRCNFWVVRDGATFGGDFVLYSDHPDVVHSKYIVVVLDNWENVEQEVSVASRAGWAVKKEVVFVRVVVPEGVDVSTPDCLPQMSIEDVSIQRVKFRG